MPLGVADVRDGPPPLGWLEALQRFHLIGFFPEQEDEATVVYEESVVMPVHTCKRHHS